ncbi:MAG: ribonuclease HII [Chloroflexi bacterium]|nr:ribonuclease HII [Chloroflexota bacterium]
MASTPDGREEETLGQQGFCRIAGIDEVGRGPLAGPVMAAAVILPPGLKRPWLCRVRDSKELSPRQRESLAGLIQQDALAVGLGMVEPSFIDRHGIVPATRRAMALAVGQLSPAPDYLLIDALALPEAALPQKAIIHGDALCYSIAAASIVAKVSRDHLMQEMEAAYPGYGFARHKGYGTAAHLECLRRLGPCPIHRRSFAPLSGAGSRGGPRP